LKVGDARKSTGWWIAAVGVLLVVGFGAMLLLSLAVLGFVGWQYSSQSVPVTSEAALMWLAGPLILLLFIVVGIVMIVVGRRTMASGRKAAEHLAWLRANGLRLPARVLRAHAPDDEGDATWLGVALQLEVMGPSGPYAASAVKLVTPDRVGGVVGSEIYVRANPQNLAEIIVDEG